MAPRSVVALSLETLAIAVVTVATLAAIGVGQGLMSFANCLETALQLVLPALLFAAVGAVASQLVGSTRGARLAAAGVMGVAVLVRTAADAGDGITWLRWTTPLGWFEELHPPGAPPVAALLAIVASGAALVGVALAMLRARDIGLGILPHRDSRAPRRFLLGAPWQAALRAEAPQLSAWLLGAVFYAVLLGGLTKAILDFYRSNSTLSNVLGPNFGLNAYLAAAFSIVQLIVVLLAVTLVVSARSEEASGRLEMVLAEPLSRTRWLRGRMLLAVCCAFALALVSALAVWAGALLAGQTVGLPALLEAALNCLPLIAVCAGGASAVLALAPRAVAFVYAPVAIAYLWEAIGGALKLPAWALDISPFHALAAVPGEDFAALPAAVLTILGLVLMGVAASAFRGRDLVSG